MVGIGAGLTPRRRPFGRADIGDDEGPWSRRSGTGSVLRVVSLGSGPSGSSQRAADALGWSRLPFEK